MKIENSASSSCCRFFWQKFLLRLSCMTVLSTYAFTSLQHLPLNSRLEMIRSILIQGLMKAGCRGEDAVAVDSSSPEPSSKRPTESRSSQRPAANTPSLSSNSPTRTPVRRRNAKRELWSLGPDISARKKVLISRAFFYKHIH